MVLQPNTASHPFHHRSDGRNPPTMRVAGVLCLATCLAGVAEAFYVQGVLQQSYPENKDIGIKVNSLTSVRNIMPFEWYSLPFCSPPAQERQQYAAKPQNLGEVLFGDKVEMSQYTVQMKKDIVCASVCELPYDERQIRQFHNRINQKYRGNMLLDGLPVAEEPSSDRQAAQGFPLGIPKSQNPNGQTILHNHLSFVVSYHRYDTGEPTKEAEYRVVGFQVAPFSVDHSENPCDAKFTPEGSKPVAAALAPGKTEVKVQWTYSVKWVEDAKVTWSTRWDVYLRSSPIEARIHWFAIINSLLVVIFLSVIVAVILLRALHKDFNRYNDTDNADEQQEETGWKLVHTEVFRKPPYALWLCVYVGSGAQLLGMSLATLVFALFGFLSPANRGALLSALIFLFVLLGSHAGYTAARMLSMFDMRQWKHIFTVGMA